MKAIVRERSRARGIPVLMATSDRGLVDVERFDLDPQRPILHGLLGNLDTASLARMTSGEKVPYLLRFLEAQHLSPRGAASLLEVDRTLSTWPQVSGDVAAGAPVIAESVRRSDSANTCRPDGSDWMSAVPSTGSMNRSCRRNRLHFRPNTRTRCGRESRVPLPPRRFERRPAAMLSLGTLKPAPVIAIRLDPELSSTMDIGYRGTL